MTSLLALLALAASQTPSKVKVYVLAGQSNMEGHGLVRAERDRNGGKGSLEALAHDPSTRAKFGWLLAPNGTWVVRDDVWIH